MSTDKDNAPRPDTGRRRVKRSTLIPVLLVIYLGVMSYIGWPQYASGQMSAAWYFGIIGITLFVIILLHFTLKKRERMRK